MKKRLTSARLVAALPGKQVEVVLDDGAVVTGEVIRADASTWLVRSWEPVADQTVSEPHEVELASLRVRTVNFDQSREVCNKLALAILTVPMFTAWVLIVSQVDNRAGQLGASAGFAAAQWAACKGFRRVRHERWVVTVKHP